MGFTDNLTNYTLTPHSPIPAGYKPPKPAQAPNPGAITQAALQDQVSQSAQARWMATLFGGMGDGASSLLDDDDRAPKNTASRVLLGGS